MNCPVFCLFGDETAASPGISPVLFAYAAGISWLEATGAEEGLRHLIIAAFGKSGTRPPLVVVLAEHDAAEMRRI
jgi:hypothetical protein